MVKPLVVYALASELLEVSVTEVVYLEFVGNSSTKIIVWSYTECLVAIGC